MAIIEKGIKKKYGLYVNKIWKGNSNNKKWAMFFYSQSEKKKDGSYENGIKYTLWIKNEEIIDKITTGMKIYIKDIISVKPSYDNYGKLQIEVEATFSLNEIDDDNNSPAQNQNYSKPNVDDSFDEVPEDNDNENDFFDDDVNFDDIDFD